MLSKLKKYWFELGFVKVCQSYLSRHEKLKQWLWFATLWCTGLLAVTFVGGIIRLIFAIGGA